MTRNCGTDISELRRTVPDGVIRSAELRAAGISNYAVSARCRPSGPWQRVLPGVVLMSTGTPTRRQRLRAAVAYAGPGSVVSGADAMRCHGIDVPCPADVLVLLPAGRRAASRSYLTVERTTRLPEPVWCNGIPVTPMVRATVDAARRESDHDRLRDLLVSTLDAGACTIDDLLAELAAGSRRGTAGPRAALAELARSPVLVGQLALDVADMGPRADRAQPEPPTTAVLHHPGEGLERRIAGARPAAPGTSDIGLISHGR